MQTFAEWLDINFFKQGYLDLGWQKIEDLADEIIKQWLDWSGGDGEGYRDYAERELGEDAGSESIEKRAEEIAKEELTDRLYEMMYKFKRFQDPLHLYREIKVQATQLPKVLKNIRLIRLGSYWSWDEHAAEPHWGMGGGNTIAMYAKVPAKFVNWKHTLIKNTIPSYQQEKEIEVVADSPINVEAIRIDGGKWHKVNMNGFA